MSEDELGHQCRVETFRGSGKGGQKRNTTNSAVRVTLETSGISAESDKTRSQHKNRQEALRLLRRKVAIEWRESPASNSLPLPPKPSTRNERFPVWMANVLDLLAACGWQVGEAARRTDKSTGRFVKDLADDRQLWQEVNRQRQAKGLKPLHSP